MFNVNIHDNWIQGVFKISLDSSKPILDASNFGAQIW